MTLLGRSEKVLFVKIFLSVLVIIFSLQSWIKADDVKDFEIEGISVSDSLLNFFNKEKISEFINHKSSYNYSNSDYTIIGISKSNQNSLNLSTYEHLGITINKKDIQYKVKSIAGQSYSFANIIECNTKQKIIAKDIKKELIGNSINEDIWENDQWISGGVVVGKSRMHDFVFNDESAVRIICYELNEEGKKFANWEVKLDVIINSKEFNKFLQNIE